MFCFDDVVVDYRNTKKGKKSEKSLGRRTKSKENTSRKRIKANENNMEKRGPLKRKQEHMAAW